MSFDSSLNNTSKEQHQVERQDPVECADDLFLMGDDGEQ